MARNRRIPPPKPPPKPPSKPPPKPIKQPAFLKKIGSILKNPVSYLKKGVTLGLGAAAGAVGSRGFNRSNNSEVNKYKEQLNSLRAQFKNMELKMDDSNKRYQDLITEKKNIDSQLKIKTEQHNKLLNDYNIQLKDKQGAMDYLTINEHFSTIEGLTLSEAQSILQLTGNIDLNYYNSIANQNKQMDTEIQKNKNNYSTDDQKVYYQSQQVDYLNLFNSYLFIIFYSLLIILCYFLYYSKTLSNYMKIGMIVGLTLFPFIIMTIEKNAYNTIMYIFAIINGIAYTKNY